MSKADRENSREGTWQKWRAEFLQRVQALDHSGFPDIVPDPGAPSWVLELLRWFGRTVLSQAKIDNESELTPARVGGLVGHFAAMNAFLGDLCSAQNTHSASQTPRTDSAVLASALETFDRLQSGHREVVKWALGTCMDLHYEDTRQFLETVVAALKEKPRLVGEGIDVGRSNFEILLFMLLWWRGVERLESVPDLQRILIQAFGANRVGDLKRVEKLCSRIGLRYRKPGRPPKRGNSDKRRALE